MGKTVQPITQKAKGSPFKFWAALIPIAQKAAKKGKAMINSGPDDLDKVEAM
jgi:hypothetical protein